MSIEEKVINTMRKLALDEIAEANSGHPGIALGIAPMLFAVYKNAKIQPKNSEWFNRDRIILSCGHGSSILYSTLYLFGYNVQLEDLQQFRKLGSRTPGHPEYRVTDGVDVSTGALGQGFANAVGMALAEQHINAKYSKKDCNICDHYTFALCGDGDLMEGISYEASAIAGKFKLNKLIVLYDNNDVTLTDKLSISSDENVGMRFQACGWNVITVENGEDYHEVEQAIKIAKTSKDKPTIIICKTIIGYGSKLSGMAKCHGKPFNKEEVAEMCGNFGVSTTPFEIDEDVKKYCSNLCNLNLDKYEQWNSLLKEYKVKYKQEYKELFEDGKKSLQKILDKIKIEKDISTREAGGIILNALAQKQSNFFGGCADVAPSTKAYIDNAGDYSYENKTAMNIPFGVREHAMSAICNGITLHQGLRSFASTFLVFSDYMRYGIRQSALMDIPTWYVFTHDSIWVGEDGPSHQPIEHIQSLRLIPNLAVFRPADAEETIAGYKLAVDNFAPTALILSRQKLPLLEYSDRQSALFGGYIVSPEKKKIDAILIANGSEVAQCIEAQKSLLNTGVDVRVVSMPCAELFFKQDVKYRNSVLPKKCEKRLAVGVEPTQAWSSFVGDNGVVMGINQFGESGTGNEVAELFGITTQNIIKNIRKLIK